MTDLRPTCYACSLEATTEEHVPPKCLFPERSDMPNGEDVRRGLIKVPSCVEHNTTKSRDDEHLMFVLAMTLQAGETGGQQFSTKIMRAVTRRAALMHQILEHTAPVMLRDEKTGETFETIAVRADWERVERSLRLVALGLHRHHFGEPWTGPLKLMVEFSRFLTDERAPKWNSIIQDISIKADLLFKDAPQHGENPAIFTYQVIDEPATRTRVMRLHFYGGNRLFAVFGAT